MANIVPMTSTTSIQHCPTVAGRPSPSEEDQRQCPEHQLCWRRQNCASHTHILLHNESGIGPLDARFCTNCGSKCARQLAKVNHLPMLINNLCYYIKRIQIQPGTNCDTDLRAQ